MVKNLLIDKQLRFAYLQIPKAACSTIKFSLLSSYGTRPTQNISQSHLHTDHLHWATYGSPYLRAILKHDRNILLPTFTVVRNPFTRTLSGYREKIELRKDSDKYITDLGFSTSKKISFDEFLDALLRRPQIAVDPHFQAQSTIISNPLIEDIAIGYMENLDEFLFHITSIIFGKANTSKLAIRNIHSTRSSEQEIIGKYYNSEETVDKVIQLYKSDFINFAYSQDIQQIDVSPINNSVLSNFTPINITNLYKNNLISMDLALREIFRGTIL